MAFMLRKHLKFIDSFQVMSTSLDKLVSNLPKEDLKYTSEEFTGDKLSLMSQKGMYSYDYLDCLKKFDQTELLTKEQFYSVLNSEHIANVEYDHARKIWETFNLKTMGEYHDLCLKSDVLLLADVFESFRKTCLQYYRVSQKKASIKLLFGAAQGFNSQFLNLFGFSISVSLFGASFKGFDASR